MDMLFMKVAAVLVVFTVIVSDVSGQELQDSSEVLEQVIVKAYENNRKLVEVPASVVVINKSQLSRFNNISLVPALNTMPGVRMEERSPGSYRLNIRGSTLRSPFGVRNVKVYYNGIPYTDPGGNTFFNQLGLYNLGRMEIIKGPGGSLYGAGTGGVILIDNDLDNFSRGATVDYAGGSYGMNSFHANLRGGEPGKLYNSVHYQYQNSNGYREQTQMERKVLSWDGVARVGEKGTLRVHFMQGNLFYETPGGLTAAEYNANPKAARPRAGQTPGAVEAHAAIDQSILLAGFSYSIVWNDPRWQSTAALYAAYSKLLNPTTRNYERRTEPHFGSRNIIQFSDSINNSKLTVQGGVEIQHGYNASKVYGNVNGLPGTMQTDDEINNRHYFGFAQAILELPKDWIITAGASLNLLKVEVDRLSQPTSFQERKYNNELAPRLAILKKITPLVSAYGSVAKGFSPPTNAEILPSTGVISTSLEAEQGINYEAGIKGNLLKTKLYFDINAFYFRLNNTIAQRRDIAGADYFVNAGSTKQNGVETFLSYRLDDVSTPILRNMKLWLSHTWNNFRYNEYQKVTDDTADYSGSKLPGIPSNFLSAGLDAVIVRDFYLNLTYYYSDPVFLNDANTDRASSYNLFNARLGYRKSLFKNAGLDVFVASDNIFEVKYSLGNDINAFGGRYYNAAPGQNYSAGISVKYNW
jgi:iron complex outermembrane receptor protein